MAAAQGIDRPSTTPAPTPTPNLTASDGKTGPRSAAQAQAQSRPRKRFVGTTSSSSSSSKAGSGSSRTPVRRVANLIPDDILHDRELNAAIAALPGNYNFEIHKTVHHVRRDGVKTVALQMPEGLMMYGCAIADIVERFTGALPMLLADVTYGACCIDDYTAREMGAEMIVHYGHSCLIPVSQTSLKTLYIFVEIAIDTPHLSLSVRRNFPSDREAFGRLVLGAKSQAAGGRVEITLEKEDEVRRDRPSSSSSAQAGSSSSASATPTASTATKVEAEADGAKRIEKIENEEVKPTRLALVSTIQFVAAVQALKANLEESMPPLEKDGLDGQEEEKEGMLAKVVKGDIGVWRGKYEVVVPQAKPLSPGEVLGCTAPKLGQVDGLIYVGDGRFHLESIMIANPQVPAFRYDPYSKKFTRETYEHNEMRSIRGDAVKTARRKLAEHPAGAGGWAVLLGTLGRQGSLAVMQSITSSLPPSSLPPLLLLLSELSPAKLALFSSEEITTFVQTSCPRLSIDWGYAFSRPLLSPYEASVAVGRVRGWGGLEFDAPVVPAAAVPGSGSGSGSGSLAGQRERQGREGVNGSCGSCGCTGSHAAARGGCGCGQANNDCCPTLAVTETAAPTLAPAPAPDSTAIPLRGEGDYPMDFYSDNSLGPWTPRYRVKA